MNKNTKILARHLRLARKAQQSTVVRMVPVYNYHSANGPLTRAQTIPVHFMDENGVVSASPSRNMHQRVFRNFGGTGNMSRTFHEPIQRGQPVIKRGHAYLEYRDFPV